MLNSKEKKSNLEMFIKLITGHFNNKEQFEEMQKSGRVYPYAEHVNTVCNDKIKNLSVDFQGKFLVEESYYETNGKKHASSHIFYLQRKRKGFYFLLMKYQREQIKIHLRMIPCCR